MTVMCHTNIFMVINIKIFFASITSKTLFISSLVHCTFITHFPIRCLRALGLILKIYFKINKGNAVAVIYFINFFFVIIL